MRVLQYGFAQNFGLAGKSVRRYLATTALTATGLMALAAPSLAGDYSDHVAFEGAISHDTSVPNVTTTTQYTHLAKVRGDGDLDSKITWNLIQPSNSSIYALYDTEADPSYVLGNINANGKFYIFDQNGVIFGEGSQVNVGSIIASTGSISDENLNAGRLVFENVGGEGKIINKGTISVAEAGLAAFVAPGVENAGVINAKMGKVVLASGNTVTLDLYGDNLVEIAVDGKLENALVKNSGTINAEGGSVALSAQAAKSAVDNVINMDGVVNVSSVSVRGGKIILGGGNKGTVKVSGKLKADGKNAGGSVKVTGENVDVSVAGLLSADAIENGDGGMIYVYGRDYAIFSGRVSARGGALGGNGGFVEISAANDVGYDGSVTTLAPLGLAGSFLIDPLYAFIHSGSLNSSNPTNRFISADSLALDLKNNANVTVQATNKIDVGSTTSGGGVGNGTVDVSTATETTYSYTPDNPSNPGLVVACGGPAAAHNPHCISIPHVTTTLTGGNLTLESMLVNFNKDLIMGTGNVNILAPTVNSNARLYARAALGGPLSLLGDSRISSTAGTVNVLSPSALINQGIWLSNDAGGATINVAAGTYNESVDVNRSVTLKGANAGLKGSSVARGPETIVDPNSPGFHVSANNVTIDGFTITGATGLDGYGVLIDNNAANTVVKNNIINGVDQQGIYALGTTNLSITNNKIDNTGDDGVYVDTTDSKTLISGNDIGLSGNIGGNGLYLTNLTKGDAWSNKINGADQNGILLVNTRFMVGSVLPFFGNTITNSAGNGIKVSGGAINHIYYNTITNADGNGIYGFNTNELVAVGNAVSGIPMGAAILLENSQNANIVSNKLHDAIFGVQFVNVGGVDNDIFGNTIWQTSDDGINVAQGVNLQVQKNKINNTGGDGIEIDTTDSKTLLAGNEIGLTGNIAGNGIYLKNLTKGDAWSNKINGADQNGILLENTRFLVGSILPFFGNTITNSGENGIKVSGGAVNHMYYNTITGAGANGIYGTNTNDIVAVGNAISGMPAGSAILLENSQNTKIVSNKLHDAVFGVKFVNVNGLDNDIFGNTIWQTSDDGINVDTGRNLTIEKNKLSDIGKDGIEVRRVRKIDIVGNNKVNGTGERGIKVLASNDINIDGNSVDNTGMDGVFVSTSNGNVKINNNRIGQESGSTINGDGIYLEQARGGFIQSNLISNTITPFASGADFNDGSGIYLHFTSNITVGGTDPLLGNIINNVAWDGVKIDGSATNTIVQNNRISDTTRIGIYSEGTSNVSALDNKVSNSNLPTWGNITILGGQGHTISRNEVWNDGASAGDHGIFLALVKSGTSVIDGNYVHGIRKDGIHLENVGGAAQVSNNIVEGGETGLMAEGKSNGTISVSGNTFSYNRTGAEFHSGIINLTGAGNIFNGPKGAGVALRFAPVDLGGGLFAQLSLMNDGNPSYGGTIGSQTFNGYNGKDDYYVRLANTAFFAPGLPTLLNGLNSNYDGIQPSLSGGILSATDFNTLEERFYHYPDQKDLGLFWFGSVKSTVPDGGGEEPTGGEEEPTPPTFGFAPLTGDIDQKDLFNVFGAFNGDLTGLNVRITGLPRLPGQGGANGGGNFGQAFNNIQTFAGNGGTSPEDLNEIDTAAGGEDNDQQQGQQPQQNELNQIDTAAGGEDANCWSDAANAAAGGQAVNVVYGGSLDDSLNQAASCGTAF